MDSERLSTADLLAQARATYERIDAQRAARLVAQGVALLVDIRPQAQRDEHGVVAPELRPLIIDRNVLEWRFEPGGPARLPEADLGRAVIVLCQQGYASSLAAHNLVRLSVAATDVIDGFEAWVAAGAPTLRSEEVAG